MNRSGKILVGLLILFLLIGAEAQQVDMQSKLGKSNSQIGVEGDFVLSELDPPKKPYSLKSLVTELQNVTTNLNDTDADGLYDSVEAILGTDFNNIDSDFDNLNDSYEIDMGLDPLNPDTNEDGVPDYHEVTDVYSLDLDGDGLPNTWDFDNDGDGVNDRSDQSPAAKSTIGTMFTFNIETDGKPLLLTFQVRPKDPTHLMLVDQTWDWPWDNESTMQDLDNSKDDLIMAPWLRVGTSNRPSQDAVSDYGVLVTSNGMEVALNPNREFGSVVAFTGRVFHPTPPASLSLDVELIWKVSGFSDGVSKALQASNGKYVTIGDGNLAVTNGTDQSEGILQWIVLSNETIALKVPNGPYLSVADDGTLVANGTSTGERETFKITYLSGSSANFKAYNDKYLSVRGDGVIVATSTQAVQYTIVDLGYYPEITQLVTYNDEFMITGLTIEESFGTDVGLFYNEDKNQTIAANLIMDYIFLRNATTTIGDMPSVLSDYNITVLNRTESYPEKNDAFVQIGNYLMPEVLSSLPANQNLPIIIATEDHCKTVDQSDIPSGSYIIGATSAVNLTAEPLIVSKGLKMNFYNTSSNDLLTTMDIMFEIDGWGLSDNTKMDLMTLVWKWHLGQQMVTNVGGAPTDFSDFLPEYSIQNCAAGISVLGLDLIGGTFTGIGIAIIETKASKTAKLLYEFNEELIKKGWSISMGGKKWGEFNFKTTKQTQILKSSKAFKVLKGISVALVVIDVLASLVFFGLSIASACKTADTYREAIDDAFGDEFLALHIVVATLLYALLIGLTIGLAVSGVGAPLAVVLGILLAVFGFFLDWLIGAIVGLIMGSPKDDFHAEPSIDLDGSPEPKIVDYDNNGLDVGDRIEIVTHLVATVKGAGQHPALRDWSYIVPWTSIAAPAGTYSTTSPNLNETLVGILPWYWQDYTTLLNRTSIDYVSATQRDDNYDSTAWVQPGVSMINFPAILQLNGAYVLRQIYYHKWIGLFKCWHHKWNSGLITTSRLTTLYFDVLPPTLDSFLKWKAIKPNDLDGDGLNDSTEVALGISDKKRYDTDADGLNDKFEIDVGTDPTYCDTDEDGLIDKYEFVYATNATDRDSDGDGIYDYLEIVGWIISFNYSGRTFQMRVFSNPALNDTDGDGYSDGAEYWSGLNPRSADTNGDGIEDVAIPQTEVVAVLENSTDIENDIIKQSCTVSEFGVDADGNVYFPVKCAGFNDSTVKLYLNLTYSDNWTLNFNSGIVGIDRTNEFIYIMRTPSMGEFRKFDLDGVYQGMVYLVYGEATVVGIDVDKNGYIYTSQGNQVNEFFPNGTYIRAIGSYGLDPDQFKSAGSVAVDDKYGFIYVIDGDGVSTPQRVMKFNKTDGTFITTLPNGYGKMVDLTVDKDGWVYILDQFDSDLGEGCVRKFDQNGMEDRNFILTNATGAPPWLLVHYPLRIEVDPAKNVYILEEKTTENPNPRIMKFKENITLIPPEIPNDKYDWDGDGLWNLYEVVGWNSTFVNNGTVTTLAVNSEPLVRDTDFDGLSDYYENLSRANPRDTDTDGDGLSDFYEWELGTNLTNDDTDGDGLSDSDEVLIGSNPINDSDTDDDGLLDLQEFQLGSDPAKIDTDDDGANDSLEFWGNSYSNSSLLDPDTDDDFMFDGLEYQLNCHPKNTDTDNDGLMDGVELIYGTNPTLNDTDWDGALDGFEVDLWLDPLDNDTDDDGLLDWTELFWGLNPFNNDTDSDGVPDSLDNDTILVFNSPILVAFDPDPYNSSLKFSQILGLAGNVTVVSVDDLVANHTDAPFIVLIGSPTPENSTVRGLMYELLADTGTILTEMMKPDAYMMVTRHGVWTSTQTIVMLSKAYPLDGYKVFSQIKGRNITILPDTTIISYQTTPISHNGTAYYFGFDTDDIDTVKATDMIISIKYTEWFIPTLQITTYDRTTINVIGKPLRFGQGLRMGEQALHKYIDINLTAFGSTPEALEEATIIFYYRLSDLDINGNGVANDPWDVKESKLTFYYFDETSGKWQRLSKDLDWVIDVGINTTDIELYGESYAGFVWVRVTHLSLFSIGGLQNVPFIDLIYIFFMLALVAVIGYQFVSGKMQRRPMDNIEYEVKGKKLLVKVDMKKEFGLSKSGKTIIVANSHGGKRIRGTDLTLGMIAYKYPEKKEVRPKKRQENQNLEINLEEDSITFTVDIEQDFGLSSTGKSIIVASSRGNKQIEGSDVFVGVNVYKKIKKETSIIKKVTSSLKTKVIRKGKEPEEAPLKPVEKAPPKPVEKAPPKPVEKAPPKPVEKAPPKPVEMAPPKPVEMAPPKPVEKAPPRPADAKPAEPSKKKEPSSDEQIQKKTLDDVPGLGSAKIELLKSAGILTIDDLINCNPETVARKVKGIGIISLRKWIQSAKELK